MTNLLALIAAMLLTNNPSASEYYAISLVSVHTNASVEFWPPGPNPTKMIRTEIVYERIVTPSPWSGRLYTNIVYLETNIIPHAWRPEPRKQLREPLSIQDPPSPPGLKP